MSLPRWVSRLGLTTAIILLSPTLLIVTGALLPGIPFVGVFGTAFESFLSLHIVLAAVAALLLALAAWWMRGGRVAAITAALSAVATLAGLIPLCALIAAAHREGASVSWQQHLHVTAIGPAATPDETVLYATLGGQKLYADVYLPDQDRKSVV